jgi:hypothetical protein
MSVVLPRIMNSSAMSEKRAQPFGKVPMLPRAPMDVGEKKRGKRFFT